MKKAFTLVELLVVIAILAVLMSVLFSSYRKHIKSAEIAKCREFVSQVKTALIAYNMDNEGWPAALRNGNNGSKGLDADAAFVLHTQMGLSHNGTRLDKSDRFGLLTTWGQEYVKQNGTAASESSVLKVGGTLADHRLRYSLSLDEMNEIDANVSGTIPGAKSEPAVRIRGSVAVWCWGPDGEVIKSWDRSEEIK